jgi:hypothetical protein
MTFKAIKFKELLKNRTDEELEELILAYEELQRLTKEMSGSLEQHERAKILRGRIANFYQRQKSLL